MKGKKTGGRTQGTPNKVTREFQQYLEENNFSVPHHAVSMFNKIPDEVLWFDMKIKLLQLIAAYSCVKPSESLIISRAIPIEVQAAPTETLLQIANARND